MSGTGGAGLGGAGGAGEPSPEMYVLTRELGSSVAPQDTLPHRFNLQQGVIRKFTLYIMRAEQDLNFA